MGKTGQRGRVVVVVVRGIAMAGTGGGMGVLHRTEEGAGTVGGGGGDSDGHGQFIYPYRTVYKYAEVPTARKRRVI